jgi:hypothetical protein
VVDELLEISRGIHPAILSEGGLGPALKALGGNIEVASPAGRGTSLLVRIAVDGVRAAGGRRQTASLPAGRRHSG